MHAWTEGWWTAGRLDEWVDGWMVGWMDRPTNGCLDSPKTVRAGTDSLLIQKETWARMTVMMQGM